jgi:hypothetical protein
MTQDKFAAMVHRNREMPTRRKHTLDEHYFDEINTPDTAYWLGFIAGDGCITDGALAVNLAIRDRDHLHKLTAALKATNPVRERVVVAEGRRYRRASLVVHSWRLVEALGHHGITPCKSATLKPWAGPGHLMPHYWRGFVDADGHVSRGPQWTLGLVGTYEVARAFGVWAQAVEPSIRARVRPNKSIWKFVVSGRLNAQAVATALYGDAPVVLSRKAERAGVLITSGPRKVERLALSLAGDRHGTTSGYRRGCRCQRCRSSHAAAAAAYKVATVR